MRQDLDQSPAIPYDIITAGPTIGPIKSYNPNLAQQNVTSGGTVSVSAGVVILVNVAATVNVLLPDPLTAVDTIWIKDLGGNAQAFNITITPSAGKTIDGLSSFVIISNHGILRLYALPNLTGWYVG